MSNTKNPRRMFLKKNYPAEIAIFTAMQEVEKAGAAPELTEVVILLGKAKDLLSDYYDQHQTINPTP